MKAARHKWLAEYQSLKYSDVPTTHPGTNEFQSARQPLTGRGVVPEQGSPRIPAEAVSQHISWCSSVSNTYVSFCETVSIFAFVITSRRDRVLDQESWNQNTE